MPKKEQTEKLKKDTYEVRRAEGRPKHGQTSFWIIGIAGVSWLLLLVAIAMGEWRTNWVGMIGYPHRRSWGLLTVAGIKTKTHTEAMADTCKYYSRLSPGGICASPICLWYRLKCQIYMDLSMVSYTTAFFLCICLVLHTLCLVWTLRLTPRMIRWAAIWWCVQVLLHMSAISFWTMMTAESFASLDQESTYPEPDFSMCFFMECVVILLMCVLATLGLSLMQMWPEESSDDSSDDSEEDDDEDSSESDDEKTKKAKKKKGGPPPGKGGPQPHHPGKGGPPAGYEPHPQGYPPQGYAPQAYDPSMGPPQGYPPQGYDPSMAPPQGYPPQGAQQGDFGLGPAA
jgi:hypothetical protein